MNNAVGYANPVRFANPIGSGTDGIGADMLDEFRVAYARLREADVTETPETTWSWLETGWDLFPEARADVVTWSYEPIDPWRLAFTTGVNPLRIERDGEAIWADGAPTQVDAEEIRHKASEHAQRLFAALEEMP